MKKLLFFFILFSFSFFSLAQNSFEKKFLAEIRKVESAKKRADIQQSQDFFKKYESFISKEKEKKKDWRVYYYTALSLVRGELISMRNDKVEANENNIQLARKYLMQVFVNNSDNVESNILLAQILLLNPNRSQINLERINELLLQAELKDKNNPRLAIVRGELALHQQDNQLAKNYFNSAIERFKTYDRISKQDPNWGKEDATYYLSLIK